MSMSVRIRIPKDEYFTTYAEGFFLGEQIIDNEVYILLDEKYPVILYYTYHNHRRLYICSDPAVTNFKNICSFPNVSKELAVITQLRGRAFDLFKENMDYFNAATKGKVYELPASFFWELSFQCKKKCNTRETINRLWSLYNPLEKLTDVKWEKKHGTKK